MESAAANKPASTKAGLVPVLLYHSVSKFPAARIADFAVTPDEFAAQIELVAESGRQAVTLSELARRMAEDDPAATDNLVCVTFDDGWRDNIAAAETMALSGVPATIYVTSGYLGRQFMVSELELGELAAIPGIEIGAHSITHPYLDEISAKAVKNEVEGSKAAIEQALGRPVESFAYPHGAYNKRARAAVVEAGFSSAAAVKNALSHAADDRFAVARWTITSGSTSDEVRSLLAGEGAPVAWSNERLRTKGFRAYRRMRRLADRDRRN